MLTPLNKRINTRKEGRKVKSALLPSRSPGTVAFPLEGNPAFARLLSLFLLSLKVIEKAWIHLTFASFLPTTSSSLSRHLPTSLFCSLSFQPNSPSRRSTGTPPDLSQLKEISNPSSPSQSSQPNPCASSAPLLFSSRLPPSLSSSSSSP